MGKIKGWRKNFETPERVEYRATVELYVPEMDAIIPKNTTVSIVKYYPAGKWKAMSNYPVTCSIDDQPFTSKKNALGGIIKWMKETEPIGNRPSTPVSMTITLSAYEYMDIVYLQTEDDEARDFIRDIFTDGWKGVQKEFPTVDKIDWGFLTLEMFYVTDEFVKVSEILDMPIIEHTIELSDPDFDPERAKRESKIKIIWK